MTGGEHTDGNPIGGNMERDLCTWLFHHLSEYIDLEMKREVCSQVEAHVVQCPSCSALVKTMQGTVEIVHDGAGQGIPSSCLERIKDRLLKGREPA